MRPFHIQGGFQRPDATYSFGPAFDVGRPNLCSWNAKRIAKVVQIRLRCVTPVRALIRRLGLVKRRVVQRHQDAR